MLITFTIKEIGFRTKYSRRINSNMITIGFEKGRVNYRSVI